MVAVGVVAVLIWGAMMGVRSYQSYRRARFYATQEYGWRQIAVRGRRDAKFASECAEYFAQLTRKYRQATWRPWLPVAPDAHAPGYDQAVEQARRANKVAPDPAVPGVSPSRR
jgi:hypothetical protein